MLLPAPLVPAARQVAMRQLVDQQHRRLAHQRGIQIELGEIALVMTHGTARQHFHAFQQDRRFGTAMRLDHADHHVHALPLQLARADSIA